MNSEFWTVVVSGSANLVMAGAMVIQTILLFVTLKYAENKLGEIESKVKISNRELHKRKAMFELNEFNLTIFFAFKNQMSDLDSFTEKKIETINEVSSLYNDEIVSKLFLAVGFNHFFTSKGGLHIKTLSKLATRLTLLNQDFFNESFGEFDTAAKNLFVAFDEIDLIVAKTVGMKKVMLKEYIEIQVAKIPHSTSDSEHPLLKNLTESVARLETLIVNYKSS